MAGSEAALIVFVSTISFASNNVIMLGCKWPQMIERLFMSSQIEERSV